MNTIPMIFSDSSRYLLSATRTRSLYSSGYQALPAARGRLQIVLHLPSISHEQRVKLQQLLTHRDYHACCNHYRRSPTIRQCDSTHMANNCHEFSLGYYYLYADKQEQITIHTSILLAASF